MDTTRNKKVYQINSQTAEKMFALQKKCLDNCYPKTHKEGYSAVVLTKDGNLYEGVSYCSDTFTLTMHGEAVALAHAALHGQTDIIAITGPNCHICKQLIYESSLRSNIDTIILVQEGEEIKQIPISKLMPYPWPDKPTL